MRDWYRRWDSLEVAQRTCTGETVVSSGNEYTGCSFSVPGFDGELLTVPAGAGPVGGDIHFIVTNATGTLVTFLVVDVSGHGPAVAELSESLETTVRELMDEPGNSALLTELNRLMVASGLRGQFATAVVGTFDVAEQSWVYAYAGHPYMLHGSGGSWRELPAHPDSSMPVGIIDGSIYYESQWHLAEGDWLLLYTDGATDMRRPSGGRLGTQGLLDLLRGATESNTGDAFGQLVERLIELNGGDEFEDDLTLVLLRRTAA